MTMTLIEPVAEASIGAVMRQGMESFAQEDWTKALTYFDTAVRARPHRSDIHNLRARTFERMGRLEDALECLERALVIDPVNVADLRNRAIVLRKLRRPTEALASYEAVLAIAPDDFNALIRCSHLLNELDRREDALACIERAMVLRPDDMEVLNTRLTVLDNLGRYQEALNIVDRMLAVNPTYVHAINNAGMLLARVGRFPQAQRCYERSLALEPDQAQARYNLSVILLSRGDWARGFQEFESRWATESLQPSRLTGIGPLWLGKEDISGKTLLLYHEQGYGDSLMSVRYIPLLAERGVRVTLAVPPPLERLMRSVPGVAQVISNFDGKSNHQYQCPLMSLPLAFGTTPDTVPKSIPYLHAEPERVSYWHQRLGERTKPRIGLAWSGRRYAPINYSRDMPLEQLRPLLELDADFISLQKEIDNADRPLIAQLPRLRHFAEELTNFADTAALVANLDLVIAVDSAVAHLAGGLGKPVWLLNRYAACWRWLQSGTDSVWYPNLRQFRQTQPGNWATVVAEVREAVTRHFSDAAGLTPKPPVEATPRALRKEKPKEKIRFVCATRLSQRDFFAQAPLGRSLPLYRSYPTDRVIELRLFANNTQGLSELYNTAIEDARNSPAILVFVHDDLYLSDYFWADRLCAALGSFDLVGLVGNKRRVSGQTSWMFLDDRFTCDSYDNFSGVLGHGKPFPDLKQLSVYGEAGVEVKLLDGVFLAIRSQTLHERDLRFDPRFKFHFYDLDFCRQAELHQVKMGTCALSLVHASPGRLGGTGWRAALRDYAEKYNETQTSHRGKALSA